MKLEFRISGDIFFWKLWRPLEAGAPVLAKPLYHFWLSAHKAGRRTLQGKDEDESFLLCCIIVQSILMLVHYRVHAHN